MAKGKDEESSSGTRSASDREEFARMALQRAIESKKMTNAWGKFSLGLTYRDGVLQTVDIKDEIVYK